MVCSLPLPPTCWPSSLPPGSFRDTLEGPGHLPTLLLPWQAYSFAHLGSWEGGRAGASALSMGL